MLVQGAAVGTAVKETKTEKMFALVGNDAPGMARWMRIVVGEERAAQKGEAELTGIAVQGKDIGRDDGHGAAALGDPGPIAQRKFPVVVTADEAAAENSVGARGAE